MNNKIQILEEYKIFGSKLRGDKDIEKRIQELLSSKESAEKLGVLAKNLAVEWKYTEENVSNLTLAFSKFEKKLTQKNQENKCMIPKKLSAEFTSVDAEYSSSAKIK